MRANEAIAPYVATIGPEIRSDDAFLSAVQRVYAAAASDDVWQTCLEEIAEVFGASTSQIEVIDGLGLDASSIAFGPVIGGRARHANSDCRARLSRFLRRQFRDSPATPGIDIGWDRRESGDGESVVHRIGGRCLLVASICFDECHQALFAIQWPIPGDEPDEDDMRRCLHLLPHLRQALAMRARLIGERDKCLQAMDALESCNHGTITIDSGGNVLQASRTARLLSEQHDGLCIFNNRLSFSSAEAMKRYRRALADFWSADADRSSTSVRSGSRRQRSTSTESGPRYSLPRARFLCFRRCPGQHLP